MENRLVVRSFPPFLLEASSSDAKSAIGWRRLGESESTGNDTERDEHLLPAEVRDLERTVGVGAGGRRLGRARVRAGARA